MAWKEQMATLSVPDEGLVLEAVWQGGHPRGAVVAPPHPAYGGSLDNPVCSELAYGLYKAGWSSLRFNWRGVGASQGAVSSETGAADADYAAALDHVADTVEAPVLAAGYSWGAATALRLACRDARIGALVLVAPPAMMLAELPIQDLTIPVRIFSGAADEFAPPDQLSAQVERIANARLEVVAGVDHFFAAGGLAELSVWSAGAGESCLDT